jgi:hypothetical protein
MKFERGLGNPFSFSGASPDRHHHLKQHSVGGATYLTELPSQVLEMPTREQLLQLLGE